MKSKMNFRRYLMIGLIIVLGSSLNQVIGQQIVDSNFAKDDNYRIGPGDVIDIVVSRNESLSRSGVKVNNQGTIQLTMIDSDITAVCLTERELADQIKEKYRKYLLNPHVIVAVREFNSTPVTLIGEILAPKQFQLQRPMRLLEVITLGNGPTGKAGEIVQIIRNPEAHNCRSSFADPQPEEQLLTYQLARTLKAEEQANPFVKPGDIVRLVEAEEAKKVQAYIIGNVQKAMEIDLREPVTLTQAIAMAGGTTGGAQIDKIKISRQIAGTTNKKSIMVNLKEINKRNEGDFYLESNDIIDVPGPSGSRKVLKDIFRTVLPSVTRFPIIP